MGMKKVIILCYDFPPKNSVGAQRPFSWFKYFHKFNYYPIIFTNKWDSKHESIITLSGEIRYVDCDSNIRTKTPLSFFKKVFTLTETLTKWNKLGLDFKNPIYEAVNSYLEKEKVDVIIATGEPFILFKYASRLSELYNIPWYADYRDDWIENHRLSHENNLSFFRLICAMEKKIERRLLNNVSGVFSVSSHLVKQISNRINVSNYLSVENGADLDLYEKTKNPFEPNTFNIIYTGSLYDLPYLIDFFKAYETFISTVKAEKIKLYFVGIENQNNQATKLVGKMKLKYPQNILIQKRKPQEEIAQYQLHANILLNLIAGDPSLGLIGAKTYSYAVTRNPILTIPNIKNKSSSFFPNRDIQRIAINEEEIISFIKEIYLIFLNKSQFISSLTNEERYSMSREAKSEEIINFFNQKRT